MHAMYIMDMAILYAVASCAVRLQIIVNPPYQESDGGNNASAVPVYQKFITEAIKLGED